MPAAVTTTGFVSAGRLQMRNRQMVADQLQRMRDGEVRITIERVHATRSAQANRYYWGVVVELLAEHTGYTADEIHDVLKAKFLPKKLAVTNGNGEIKGEFVVGGTTTKLDKLEFGEYVTRIRQWALDDLGVLIPEASE